MHPTPPPLPHHFSHFTTQTEFGGQQMILVQMSASSYTSYSSTYTSISASAQQTWAMGSAGVSYDQTSSQTKATASYAAYGKLQTTFS